MRTKQSEAYKFIGQKINSLEIIGIKINDKNETVSVCKCDCGTEKNILLHEVKAGIVGSCGCSRQKWKDKVKIGTKIEHWTVVGEPMGKKHDRRVPCICICGIERDVLFGSLVYNRTSSCGCMNPKSRPGAIIHGLSKHPLYHVWRLMKERCDENNKVNKKYYFDRGITICDEWLNDVSCFVEWGENNGYKRGLQIDRINNDGNYEPNNCRFVNPMVNAHNRRLIKSNNTSGYCGIRKRGNNYSFRIEHKGIKTKHASGFKTPEEAAIARDIFIIKNNLPHALNFPELRYNLPI